MSRASSSGSSSNDAARQSASANDTVSAADDDSPLPIGTVDDTTASMPASGRPSLVEQATTAAT